MGNILKMRNKSNREQNYNIEDAAQLLGVSTATVRNWIRLGNLYPDASDKQFSGAYLKSFTSSLCAQESAKLKSRRNKIYISHQSIYKDYIKTAHNQHLVETLLSLDLIKTEADMRVMLANFALQLYCKSRNISYKENSALLHYMANTKQDVPFFVLVQDLLSGIAITDVLLNRLKPAFELDIQFVPFEDILGLVYISLRNIGERKKTGSYFTPNSVTDLLVGALKENDINLTERTFFDPSCGSGNFLLKLMQIGVPVELLHGQDIELISVFLARINIALFTNKELSVADLRERVVVGDTLLQPMSNKFDVILGNPPWGAQCSDEDAVEYKKKFVCPNGNKIETASLFLERSLTLLNPKGIVAFVLPESLISVAQHREIREIVSTSASIMFLYRLGDAFDGVQCPSVVLCVHLSANPTAMYCKFFEPYKKHEKPLPISEHVALGYDKKKHEDGRFFTIRTERNIDAGNNWTELYLTDKELVCLQSINSTENITYLKNNAHFALGIVTGDNAKFLSKENHDGYELILKGADVRCYGFEENWYVKFDLDKFQQVAPMKLYRAKEKLIYRFISDTPVFAYDNQQTLTLNSCNIVIPNIAGLCMKYILTVLNSSVVAWFVKKKFNSIKLLKSHIEQIPIPMATIEQQERIVELVDSLMSKQDKSKKEAIYWQLDELIFGSFGLSEENKELIQLSLKDKKLML